MNTIEENSIEQTEIAEADGKQYLIDGDKFLLLKQCQQQISKLTEFSPTLRKLVNKLITVENLEKVKMEIMAMWNN